MMLDLNIYKFQGGQSTLENCQVLQVFEYSSFASLAFCFHIFVLKKYYLIKYFPVQQS